MLELYVIVVLYNAHLGLHDASFAVHIEGHGGFVAYVLGEDYLITVSVSHVHYGRTLRQ